jgi:DNA (cytosine-5)-methyltransferase 1
MAGGSHIPVEGGDGGSVRARPFGHGSRERSLQEQSPPSGLRSSRGEPYRVLSLFAGIGGFDLGLERTGGFKTVAFCEIDPFCQKVLAKHWPGVPCYDDVRTLTAEQVGPIDVICGGFPCQDISSAGTRLGLAGERSGLWGEYARLIRELRPRFAIVENSTDLLARGMGTVLGDLASSGYNAVWDGIPAAAVGAQILRDRTYIIAFADKGDGFPGLDFHSKLKRAIQDGGHRLRPQFRASPTCPSIREDVGVSKGLDGTSRREALGNAVVPQIPELIGRAILEAEAA